MGKMGKNGRFYCPGTINHCPVYCPAYCPACNYLRITVIVLKWDNGTIKFTKKRNKAFM